MGRPYLPSVETMHVAVSCFSEHVGSRFFSYKTSRVWMDSVAMRFCVPFLGYKAGDQYCRNVADPITVRRLAALKAVQARRAA